MKRKLVVKMGGSTLDAENILSEFAESIKLIHDDCSPVIVHGGGKDIGRQLEKMGREFKFIDGLRVTDGEVIDVVEMVLSGLVNKWITRALCRTGLRAAGISGTDLGLFNAIKYEVKNGDLGFVGAITEVNPEIIDIFLEKDIVPVVSPISLGPESKAYNVNADHAAAKFAEEWKADDLIFITDVPGIKVGGEVRSKIYVHEVERLIDGGDVTGGMIPKLMNSAAAVVNGVKRVHIIGWDGVRSIKDALGNGNSFGTTIE